MEIANYTDLDYVLKCIAEREISITSKEAEMNSKINELKEQYAKDCEEDNLEKENLLKEVEDYCIKNKNDFEKVRSKSLTFGTVGFRNNPPKVMTLNRKYSMPTAKELVKKLFRNKYIRTITEIDKEKILADYAGKKLTDAKLANVGLRIDNAEKFFYELNWETLEPATAEKAAVRK